MKKQVNKYNTTAKEELTLNTIVGDTDETNSTSSESENTNKILLQRVEGTPFDLHSEGGKVGLKVGKWTVSEVLEDTEENKQEILELVRRRDWNLIMGAIGALIELNTEYKNLTQE